MVRPRLEEFEDAPPGAYVCEEGWLAFGEQAWTLDEWRAMPTHRRPHPRVLAPPKVRVVDGRIRYHTEEDRIEAIRRSNREHMRRKRGGAKVLHAVASLHSFACSGPTKATGCRCHKTILWREEGA